MQPNAKSALLGLLSLRNESIDPARLEGWPGAVWDEFLELARAHRVGPLLHHRMDALGLRPPAVPDGVWGELRRSSMVSAWRNTQILHQLSDIAGWLGAEGISLVVLKGAHLADALYGNRALRPTGDLDILVREANAEQAYALFKRHGWRPLGTYDTRHHLMPLSKPNATTIEIHTNLSDPAQGARIATEGVWDRAIPFRCGSAEVLGLSREDLLLHLCCHMSYQHLFGVGLLHVCDVAWAAARWGKDLDWGLVGDCARRWGIQRGASLALRVANELLGAEWPEDVWRALEGQDENQNAATCPVLKLACSKVFDPQENGWAVGRSLAKMWQAESLRAKASVAWRSFALPPDVLAKMYGIEPTSPRLFWYYLVRCKDVILRYWPSFWRLLAGDGVLRNSAQTQNRLALWLTGDH